MLATSSRVYSSCSSKVKEKVQAGLRFQSMYDTERTILALLETSLRLRAGSNEQWYAVQFTTQTRLPGQCMHTLLARPARLRGVCKRAGAGLREQQTYEELLVVEQK